MVFADRRERGQRPPFPAERGAGYPHEHRERASRLMLAVRTVANDLVHRLGVSAVSDAATQTTTARRRFPTPGMFRVTLHEMGCERTVQVGVESTAFRVQRLARRDAGWPRLASRGTSLRPRTRSVYSMGETAVLIEQGKPKTAPRSRFPKTSGRCRVDRAGTLFRDLGALDGSRLAYPREAEVRACPSCRGEDRLAN